MRLARRRDSNGHFRVWNSRIHKCELKYLSYLQHWNNMCRNGRNCPLWRVRLAKIQISLRIRAAWSESYLSAWKNFASIAVQNASSEDSDLTAQMRSLIWIFAERKGRGFVFGRCDPYSLFWWRLRDIGLVVSSIFLRMWNMPSLQIHK